MRREVAGSVAGVAYALQNCTRNNPRRIYRDDKIDRWRVTIPLRRGRSWNVSFEVSCERQNRSVERLQEAARRVSGSESLYAMCETEQCSGTVSRLPHFSSGKTCFSSRV
jgi:hypothetical protein